MDPRSLCDWVVIGGKTGLVRGILGHESMSSDTWKVRGLWVGSPGLICLETMVGAWGEDEEGGVGQVTGGAHQFRVVHTSPTQEVDG